MSIAGICKNCGHARGSHSPSLGCTMGCAATVRRARAPGIWTCGCNSFEVENVVEPPPNVIDPSPNVALASESPPVRDEDDAMFGEVEEATDKDGTFVRITVNGMRGPWMRSVTAAKRAALRQYADTIV